jgi:simple sugar transport system permease protein
LFFLGIAVAFLLHYVLERTRWGLHLRAVGDAPEAARSMGISVRWHRVIATTIGGALAGIGGAHLTLYFPGIWSEGISGGQGLMAVALVIFARWSPRRCLAASLLFGGAQALGPSLQSAGITGFYHLFNASPYLLTLALMILSCSRSRTLAGIPGALVRRG